MMATTANSSSKLAAADHRTDRLLAGRIARIWVWLMGAGG